MNGKGNLYRSSDDVVIAGVCAGLASRFDLNVFGLRTVVLLVMPIFSAFILPAYLVLWAILKPRPTRDVIDV